MSNIPYELNLEVVTGDYGDYTITYVDGDGVAIDITSWEFSLYGKLDKDDADTDALIKLDNDDFTNNGASGIVGFKLLARDGDGEPLTVQDLFYQIKVIYDSSSYNYPQTHFSGKLSITKTAKKEV